jgi:hypothetical protein
MSKFTFSNIFESSQIESDGAVKLTTSILLHAVLGVEQMKIKT